MPSMQVTMSTSQMPTCCSGRELPSSYGPYLCRLGARFLSSQLPTPHVARSSSSWDPKQPCYHQPPAPTKRLSSRAESVGPWGSIRRVFSILFWYCSVVVMLQDRHNRVVSRPEMSRESVTKIPFMVARRHHTSMHQPKRSSEAYQQHFKTPYSFFDLIFNSVGGDAASTVCICCGPPSLKTFVTLRHVTK